MAPNQTRNNVSSRPVSLNLYKEEERKKTFANWPHQFVRPEELASDGFYYTGVGDKVRCAFCGIEITGWTEGDKAHQDHCKFAPHCDIVNGIPCGNIPSGESSSGSEGSSPSSSFDVCGPFNRILPFSAPERGNADIAGSLLQDLEQLGVSKTSGPVRPKYALETERLKTFDNWPPAAPVKPNDLAAAGFFYTGVGDHALCFYCDGGLKDWEDGDDPWTEHARWFSRCEFVLRQKGRDFVSKAVTERPALISAQEVSDLLEERSQQERGRTEQSVVASIDEGPVRPTSDRVVESTPVSLREMEVCQICFLRERAIVFLPCGHFVACGACASALSNCPMCRKPYEATVRAYLS